MTPVTLVVGASGQIGAELADRLVAQGQTVRRATHQTPQRPDQVQLNLATGDGLTQALAGADQAFLMAPPGFARQDELLIPAIEAARAAGVRKVVMLSALGANAADDLPLRRAERHLESSGLRWNVLRPNWFMQNFHTFWLHGIRTQGQIMLPAGQAKGSFIDTRDVAAGAARLLQDDDFVDAAHDLTGAEALDHNEVAAILSRAVGRPIGYTDLAPEAMRQGLLGAGLPADYTEFLLTILAAFKAGHAAVLTDGVQRLTGRLPRRFEAYAQEHRGAWA